MEVYSSLKLTPDEEQKLTALVATSPQQYTQPTEQARRELHEKALAILTPEQRKIIQDYRESHRHLAQR
jgi:Spy/CpxP family protein refolding chaperone